MTNSAPSGVPKLAVGRSEAAFAAGVSASTFDKMVLQGAMPRARVFGGRRLWLLSEIEAHLFALPDAANDGGEAPAANPWDGAS